MSTKQNKAIVRRMFEELNKGNIKIVDEILADDFVDHTSTPGQTPDRPGFKQSIANAQISFPDYHFNIEHIIAEADKVACHFTMRGTDTGGFMGLPPTGKQVSYAGISILRFANAKVVERWVIYDSMSLLQHLGLI